ncbi:MAG: SsgA family sporulation/cell division regulator [Nocardioides sp.]
MRDAFKDSVADDVRHDVSIDCIDVRGNQHQLPASLGYRPSDPFAATLTFYLPGEKVVWTFGRELLFAGLYEPAGDGDVHVWPEATNPHDQAGTSVLMIELCSADGQLLAQVPGDEVRHFLDRTYLLVPVGTEGLHLDLDNLVARLINS